MIAGSWQTRTWQAVLDDVIRWANALRLVGLRTGDHCVTICENRYEWLLLDLGIQFVGAVHVPLNPLLTLSQMQQLIEHCQPRCVIASQREVVKSLSSADSPRIARCTSLDAFAVAWTSPTSLAHENAPLSPEDLLSIIYTSGTTGDPKGVMLTHSNVMSNVRSKLAMLPLSQQDVRLAWLPWTHIFGRVCDLYTGIAAGCQTIISRGRDFLFEELRAFAPTYLNGVPYFYEKCYRLLAARNELEHPDALNAILGGRIQVCNCGGAPLANHVFDYFRSRNVPLVCGYGLTETSPVLTSNRLDAWRRGSVGRAVPGVSLKLAADGEILATGPNVMVGYYRDPLHTAEVLQDGWFHTGDLGSFDAEGFLFITGRKKELIVLNTGYKVAPILLEHRLMAQLPVIHQCLVVGDRRDFLAALIVLDVEEANRRWPRLRLSVVDSRVIRDDEVNDYVSAAARCALFDCAPHEQIGRFALLSKPFSIADGLVTAKQSLRRDAIQTYFATLIDDLYAQRYDSAQRQSPDVSRCRGTL